MLMQLEKSHLAASNWYKVALKLLHDQWDLGMEWQREKKIFHCTLPEALEKKIAQIELCL